MALNGSLKSPNLAIAVLYSVYAVDTLLYAVNLTSDTVTLTFDLLTLNI